MKRLLLSLFMVLALSVSASADISFIGGGGGGGGSGTITTGSWTPGVAGDTGAGTSTYTVQIGGYTEWAQPGGQTWVLLQFQITAATFTGATGNLYISGVPVGLTPLAPSSNVWSGDIANFNALTLTANYTVAGTQMLGGNNKLFVIQSGSAQSAAFVPTSGAGGTVQLIGAIFYRVA